MLKRVFRIDSPDFPVSIAIILLICVPILLFQQKASVANQIATYAYFLFVIGLLWKATKWYRTKVSKG
jgi:hypothetical protein